MFYFRYGLQCKVDELSDGCNHDCTGGAARRATVFSEVIVPAVYSQRQSTVSSTRVVL